jgi:hypothetical protein
MPAGGDELFASPDLPLRPSGAPQHFVDTGLLSLGLTGAARRRRAEPEADGLIRVQERYDRRVHTHLKWRSMARVTISLPQGVKDLARDSAREGESFSATVARLIEQGAAAERGARRPRYVASGDGSSDLGEAAERYLADIVDAR